MEHFSLHTFYVLARFLGQREQKKMDHEGHKEEASVSTEQPRCLSVYCSSIPLQPLNATTISNTKGHRGRGKVKDKLFPSGMVQETSMAMASLLLLL